MSDNKEKIQSSYTLGILSIIFGIFTPFAGLLIGIIGASLSNKQKGAVAEKAKKLNKIGIIVSIIVMILTALALYLTRVYYPELLSQDIPLTN